LNFKLPVEAEAGSHVLRMSLGRRRLAPVGIEVV
jgi:hypothetical protein